MNCEICGKPQAAYNAIIEGSKLAVCEGCSKFGKIISKAEINQKPLPKNPSAAEKKEYANEIISDEYGVVIKTAREKLGLPQEEFAKKINEKASLVHKLETYSIVPSIELARKLEKFLKIKLVLEYEGAKEKPAGKSSETITIGDVLNIKK